MPPPHLLASLQSRQRGSRRGEIRLDPQRLLVVADGFPELARLLQGDPEVVVRLGVIGLDPQGLLQMIYRFRQPALFHQRFP